MRKERHSMLTYLWPPHTHIPTYLPLANFRWRYGHTCWLALRTLRAVTYKSRRLVPKHIPPASCRTLWGQEKNFFQLADSSQAWSVLTAGGHGLFYRPNLESP